MTIELPDGRVAQTWVGGCDVGPTVVFFHGTPDTRWVARTGEAAAREAGVRLLCVNRPGYGLSTPAASTHVSVAHDAVAVADDLGVGSFAALGMSVGGTYAAACAAAYPDRVTALGLVATPAMTGTDDDSVEAAMERYRPEFEQWAAGIAVEDPDDVALTARFLAGLHDVEAALLRDGLGDDVAASVREALADHDGYLRDAALLFRPWDVRVEDVGCPAFLWYGAEDPRALAAVPWWTDRLADAVVDVRPRTAHLATLLTQWPTILSALGAAGSG